MSFYLSEAVIEATFCPCYADQAHLELEGKWNFHNNTNKSLSPFFNDPFLWRYKCTKCRKIICPNFKTFLTQMVTISGPLKWKSLTCLLFPKKTTTKVNKIESFSNSVQNYLTWADLPLHLRILIIIGGISIRFYTVDTEGWRLESSLTEFSIPSVNICWNFSKGKGG